MPTTDNYRNESRKGWFGTTDSGMPSLEEINTGSLQRIADATEKMAQRYADMERDLEWYKKRYNERGEEINRLTRSNNALRGYINRLKRLKK